jgi:hypothetical protein
MNLPILPIAIDFPAPWFLLLGRPFWPIDREDDALLWDSLGSDDLTMPPMDDPWVSSMKRLWPRSMLAFQKSSRGKFMAFRRTNLKKEEGIMDWRLIFEQSPVNGGVYTGDELVPRVFRPVANSWFQHRLAHVRAELKKELLEESTPFTKDS